MGNTTDNILNARAVPVRRCHIAYTLNNTQPVRCTLIGDEPLFYMDYEGTFDLEDTDDGFDATFNFDAVEKGLADLRAKVNLLDQMADDVTMTPAAALMEQMFDDQCRITGAHKPVAAHDISTLESFLRKSRLASAFLDHAESFDTTLRYSDHVTSAQYDRDANLIFINPSLDETDQILLAARELRTAWQHRNGALLHPLSFHPDQAILVNRAQIADATAMMVRMAWDLQLAGEKAPWERLENGGMADLVRAFAREACTDFRTLNNGSAVSAVFEAWFLSERCLRVDRRLIQAMLSDYQGYVFESEQVSQNLASEFLMALGSMPFGKNYLAPFVPTVLTEAIFTEVRDRANANFLWFIKFERSFRESERDLQTDSTVKDRDDHSGSSITKKQRRIGSDDETANIVALPRGTDGASPSQAQGSGARLMAGGNVVAFRRGRE